jgi:hypothetical protein
MPFSASIGTLSLRTIAWSDWDPIGLNGSEGGWRYSDAANEYDRYMLRVLEGLRNGEPASSLIDYLVGIEVEHMGVTKRPDARTRATATVAAIEERLVGSMREWKAGSTEGQLGRRLE